MPSTNAKGHRRGPEEKSRRGKLAERSSSFHGRAPAAMAEQLIRPRTVPDLLSSGRVAVGNIPAAARPLKLTKLLLNVTIQRSPGPVQVVVSPELTVGDLIAAALRQYGKECRRPILASTDPSAFDLHYSQFSLESLDRDEKLMALGSRNFFLCPRKSSASTAEGSGDGGGDAMTATCSKQAEKASKIGLPWLKFLF